MPEIKDYLEIDELTSDGEIKKLFQLMRGGTPFALARFNDGEMKGVERVGSMAARGCQRVDRSLHEKLIEGITHEQENYFIGMPCRLCYAGFRRTAEALVRRGYEYKTRATVLTNRNWLYFIQNFAGALGGRKLYWLCGDDQKLDFFSELGVDVEDVLRVPTVDSWSMYKEASGAMDFPEGAVVGLSCGPMSRVLAKEGFEARPDMTFLDIGAGFDPFARNVWHSCHKGWLDKGECKTKECPECN